MNSNTKYNILRTVMAIIIAMGVAFVIIFLTSNEPIKAIMQFLTGPLQSTRRFGNVIEAMIPLIFTGVGISIMFSASQINLAGEGAFHIGGLVATCIALNFSLPAGVGTIICIFIAALCASLVTAIPAALKIKTDSDILVSSLMMNYIVMYFSNYILNNVLRDQNAGAVVSFEIPQALRFSSLLKGTNIHMGLFIALVVSILGYIFLYKTKMGYEIRLTGENKEFARYSGINIVKVTMISALLGGFIFGIGGSVELLGMYSRYSWTALLGYGWDAVIITTLAKKNPLYVPLAAFFLAYLRTGASIMARSTDVPTEIVVIAQGIIILFIAAEHFLSKYRHKMIAKEAKLTLNQTKEVR